MTTLHERHERQLAILRSQLDRNIDLRDGTIERLIRLTAKIKSLAKAKERLEKRMAKAAEEAKPLKLAAAAEARMTELRTKPMPPDVMKELTRESAPAPYQPGQSMATKIDDVLHGAAGDDPIPDFLKRVGPVVRTSAEIAAAKAADDAAGERIKAAQAEAKQARARARISKMKAKQAGDLKRMPLSGKAALEKIRAQG